jgi:hypothetical protein
MIHIHPKYFNIKTNVNTNRQTRDTDLLYTIQKRFKGPPKVWTQTFILNKPTTLPYFKVIIPHQNKCGMLITPIV